MLNTSEKCMKIVTKILRVSFVSILNKINTISFSFLKISADHQFEQVKIWKKWHFHQPVYDEPNNSEM